MLGKYLMAVTWFVTLSVYLGIAAVISSVFDIQHPKGLQYTPPISVTMQCDVYHITQFSFATSSFGSRSQ